MVHSPLGFKRALKFHTCIFCLQNSHFKLSKFKYSCLFHYVVRELVPLDKALILIKKTWLTISLLIHPIPG